MKVYVFKLNKRNKVIFLKRVKIAWSFIDKLNIKLLVNFHVEQRKDFLSSVSFCNCKWRQYMNPRCENNTKKYKEIYVWNEKRKTEYDLKQKQRRILVNE